MTHPNEDIVRRGYQAFTEGDMDTMAQLMSPDVVHRVPGTSDLAGEYQGQEAVFGYYAKLFALTDGTFQVDLQEVRADGDDRVVARHRNVAQRGSKRLDDGETLTFRVSNGKITELEDQPDDQAAADEFWA